MATADLAAHLLDLPEALDGLTLSGGEPFDQAAALAALLQRVRAARPAWTVMAFSGYTHAQLLEAGAAQRALLAQTDLLIDGPFRRDQPSWEPLAGSANQRLIALTARGRIVKRQVLSESPPLANLGVGENGAAWLIGVLSPTQREAYHQMLPKDSTSQSKATNATPTPNEN
ncbi:putative anaerobic ribonucleoside-triphosphate reductase activating protein [Magnetofaba australis IT-1]|uniref:Putative anaerobic ribonucleoside-triphosphate reductase activating protein n=1 Tax=Magnetofaba australis IT-1 TaxID=1434232 RepID=A0A1Y2JZN0_9PROT|nr:putative anaerobic ribonucleoside-triphosphate reductase activating protein [Magnetofaba australis IT-1]